MPVLVPTPARTGSTYTTRYVRIGDLTLSTGGGSVGFDGNRWVLEDVTGWDNQPGPVGGDSVQRTGQDGVWVEPAYRGARVVTLTASLGGDWTTTTAAMRALTGSIGYSDLTTIVVGGAGPEMQADVRHNGEPLVAGNQGMARISLSLLAPDPRRFSTALTSGSTTVFQALGGRSVTDALVVTDALTVADVASGGVLTLTNDGDAPAPWVAQVAGPIPGFTLTHLASGRTLRFPDAVPDGRTLTVDSSTFQATLDGSAPRVVTGSWFELAPGYNQIGFTPVGAVSLGAVPTLTMSFRSAWR